MNPRKPITIVGGGLAGLTLGIGLGREGIPVTLWEAGRYPRHRVCGEFICGRGQGVLERLGLRQLFNQAGAFSARTAAFCLGKISSPARPIAPPAWCLSRLQLDARLAARFRECGGNLREGERWREDQAGEGIVRTSGRRLRPVDHGWRWLGLKVHARDASLRADLEMHGLPDAYVGLCRLGDESVNICGLFRLRTNRRGLPAPGPDLLRGHPGTQLHKHLEGAVLDKTSFCGVAGFSFGWAPLAHQAECCLGDALAIIPPVTGNGMSMALEAAELALEPLAAYSGGAVSWQSAQQAIARLCQQAFAQRLAWARWLQWLMFTPLLRGPLGRLALNSDRLWRVLFQRTR